MLGHGRDVPLSPAGCDDHMVAYRGFALEVDGDDVLCLIVVQPLQDPGQHRALLLILIGLPGAGVIQAPCGSVKADYGRFPPVEAAATLAAADRKSTRLNSSH